MFHLYRFITMLLYVVAFPVTRMLSLLGGSRWSERLGYATRGSGNPGGKGKTTIWFHAASVGEVMALKPVVGNMLERELPVDLLITTMTTTGREICMRHFGDDAVIRLVPADFPAAVRRMIGFFDPDSLILVETELWPNLIHEAQSAGLKTGIVNGRISNASFPFYRRFGGLLGSLLADMDLLVLQDETSSRRFRFLGAPGERIRILPNTKFDGILQDVRTAGRQLPEGTIPPDSPTFIAGSVRSREEDAVLDVVGRLLECNRKVYCIVAPRHLGRVLPLERKVRALGLEYDLFSRISRRGNGRLLIVDVIGELNNLYFLSDVAFVGGTIHPYGGQNLLEPAAMGMPVIFGPHYDNFRDVGDLLLTEGGGLRADDGEALFRCVRRLLENSRERRELGKKAREAVEMFGGASARTVDLLLEAGILPPP